MPDGRGTGRVLTVLCLAELMLAIDITIVTVANPDIERSLGFTAATLQWTLTAYALTYGGFLLLGGRLADLFGGRRLFVAGMGGFVLASLGAAAADSPVELVACRAAQGLAAAVAAPAALAILATTFREGRERDRAYAIWATAGSLGAMIGFLLGGLLTSTLGWRSIFLINGPVGAVAIVGATVWLPHDTGPRRRRALDLPGALTATAGVGLLIYGVSQAQASGWAAPETAGPLVLAALLLGLFVVIEGRTPEPLLPPRLLLRRGSVANLALAVLGTVSTAALFLSSLYMQQVFGYGAGTAGAATLSLPVGYGVGANLGSRAITRLGSRRVAVAGFVLLAAGLLWLARIPTHGSYASTFLPGLLVLGAGLGMAQVPCFVTANAGVGHEDHGAAAGLSTMAQQMGGAVGLAVLATVAASAAPGTGLLPGEEATGIRVALLVAVGIALVGAALAHAGVPSAEPSGEGVAGDAAPALPG
jgi:EmrB/QacA subfamily drug resistance transporter